MHPQAFLACLSSRHLVLLTESVPVIKADAGITSLKGKEKHLYAMAFLCFCIADLDFSIPFFQKACHFKYTHCFALKTGGTLELCVLLLIANFIKLWITFDYINGGRLYSTFFILIFCVHSFIGNVQILPLHYFFFSL